MEFSVNTVCLYPERDLEGTVQAALAHGFSTFEQWSVPPEGIREMVRLENAYPIRFSTVAARDYILNDASHRETYLQSLEEYMQELTETSCRTIITQVGMDTGEERAVQHKAIVEGLTAAVPMLEKYGFVLLMEPLNTVKDHIGYYLSSSQEGFDIIREVNSPAVRLLFDIYHQLQMGEDILSALRGNLDLIAHYHIAGIPNRDEQLWTAPGDYAPIFAYLRDQNVRSPIGIELFPSQPGLSDRVLEELRAYQ